MYAQRVVSFLVIVLHFTTCTLPEILFLTQECEPPVSSVEGTIIAYEDLDNAFSILIQEEEDKYTTFEVEKCQMILALDCKEEELVSNLKIRMPLTCLCKVKNGNVEEISLQ